MDREGSIKLLSAILADLPQLSGASCVGQHGLFDELPGRGHQHHDQEQIRLTEAATLCATCPARPKCPTVTTSTTIALAVGVRRSSTWARPSTPTKPCMIG